jgi:DNA-directed RNA polymerase sigma subunit (sigma70/sigma32)
LSGIREVNIGGRSKSYSNGKLQKYRKMKKELAHKLGRNPSVGELSIELGWRINTVLSYERQLYDIASIEDVSIFSSD